MKGNTLAEFMDDILTMGGPEKEYEYRCKNYMLETYHNDDKNCLEFVIFECSDVDDPYVFRCYGKTLKECFEQFEVAKIFDGRTIYEAHEEITVLFG